MDGRQEPPYKMSLVLLFCLGNYKNRKSELVFYPWVGPVYVVKRQSQLWQGTTNPKLPSIKTSPLPVSNCQPRSPNNHYCSCSWWPQGRHTGLLPKLHHQALGWSFSNSLGFNLLLFYEIVPEVRRPRKAWGVAFAKQSRGTWQLQKLGVW